MLRRARGTPAARPPGGPQRPWGHAAARRRPPRARRAAPARAADAPRRARATREVRCGRASGRAPTGARGAALAAHPPPERTRAGEPGGPRERTTAAATCRRKTSHTTTTPSPSPALRGTTTRTESASADPEGESTARRCLRAPAPPPAAITRATRHTREARTLSSSSAFTTAVVVRSVHSARASGNRRAWRIEPAGHSNTAPPSQRRRAQSTQRHARARTHHTRKALAPARVGSEPPGARPECARGPATRWSQQPPAHEAHPGAARRVSAPRRSQPLHWAPRRTFSFTTVSRTLCSASTGGPPAPSPPSPPRASRPSCARGVDSRAREGAPAPPAPQPEEQGDA